MHRINPEKLQFANLATRTYPMDMDNKFKHHPPTSDTVANAHQRIREECAYLSSIISQCVPVSDEKDEAVKKLQEVMFWSNAGIARHLNARE